MYFGTTILGAMGIILGLLMPVKVKVHDFIDKEVSWEQSILTATSEILQPDTKPTISP